MARTTRNTRIRRLLSHISHALVARMTSRFSIIASSRMDGCSRSEHVIVVKRRHIATSFSFIVSYDQVSAWSLVRGRLIWGGAPEVDLRLHMRVLGIAPIRIGCEHSCSFSNARGNSTISVRSYLQAIRRWRGEGSASAYLVGTRQEPVVELQAIARAGRF